MKILTILLMLIVLDTQHVHAASGGHAEHHEGHEISVSELSAGEIDPEGEQINVNVLGLVCDFCAQAIEKVFMKRQGVAGIKVDLSNGLITIFTKKDNVIDDAILSKLIVDAGYNVDSISRVNP